MSNLPTQSDNQNDSSNDVRLLVNGTAFGGWKSVRIEAGIERQARSFALEVTDRWPGQTDIPRRVTPGDAVQVFIGADLVCTGYIDATPIKYDGKSFSVGVKGRSKTADLVDCCPIEAGLPLSTGNPTWKDVIGKNDKLQNIIAPPPKSAAQWRNQKMETIAAALAAPYGVRVIAELDTGAVIPDHQVQQGETVFESIDRMMRLRHVLSTDNARGDLVFVDVGSAGRATTALVLGENILSASADLDYQGVFSEYICKGQRAGNDEQYGADVAEEEGVSSEYSTDATGPTSAPSSASVSDSRAKRRRVLVIKQSGQANEGTCTDRADYERAHRAAKALQTRYTLCGWRQADGALWLPNMLVQVRDPLIGFDTLMLIAEVAFVLNPEGLRVEITVGPPDGYRTKAGSLKESGKGGGATWSDVK
jgi:prophage tail gpP-like protein